MSDLTVIIPAYNEEASLRLWMPMLLEFIKSRNMELIIVNDGSKDGTLDLLKEFDGAEGFRFISHKVNQGYGGAIKTGIRNATTDYVITIDADGQHHLDDVLSLHKMIVETDADMIVGSRMAHKDASFYRGVGKRLIRWFAKLLLPIHIDDINSGMKIYNTEMAKRYIRLCPDHMAYSDIIAMVFISKRHLVLEQPINIKPRAAGVSTISTLTAIETVREILNIVILFNPMRVFLPIAIISIVVSLVWGIPIALNGRGVSTGAMLGLTTGMLFFFLGLIAKRLLRSERIALMSSRDPQVEKRFYTRLMDAYRYNDIYIPGFNFVTRNILRYKAGLHVAWIKKAGKGFQDEIDDWVESKTFFFGYGVYRSGTTFLADFLNRNIQNALIQHEANVNDYWYYGKAIQAKDAANDYAVDYRKQEIYIRTRDHQFEVYGEINPFLRRHCAAMKIAFPQARQFQIVRNPRNVIRSLMSRELFSKKDPMARVISPPKNDSYSEKWSTMSRFEKLCWLWAADNRFIRENVNHFIQFEKLRKDFDYFDDKVLKYLGLGMRQEAWEHEINQTYNPTPKYTFPAYRDWSADDKRVFEKICGEEMTKYGY